MPPNADRMFLRKMCDHHKGMVGMAEMALRRQGTRVRSIAEKLRLKQAREIKQMQNMLREEHDETYRAKLMPKGKEMVQRLKSERGDGFGKAFLEQTIMHHEEGIMMIDRYLPRLASRKLEAMARKMKTDQRREVAEFRRKTVSWKGFAKIIAAGVS